VGEGLVLLPRLGIPLLASIMHLTTTEYPEDLVLGHCHFPTSARRDVKNYHYETASIFDHGRLDENLGKNFGSLEDLVRTAWAILLRNYLRGDVVSFAVLLGCQGYDSPRNNAEEAPFRGDIEDLILQYELFDGCRIQDIRATACWKSTRQALKKTQINTAINLLSSLSRKNGQANGETKQLTDAHHDVSIDDVSSFLLSWSDHLKFEMLTF
jgi:hypothetical protein